MQNGEKFEHYTPQFPLPSDITTMSRQDTVCQFCGVSYLIHNEIKALEDKCQKLEADLVYYAGMSSREQILEEKLQNERMKTSDLESTVNINTHKINELTRRLQLVQDQYQQSEKAHQETRTSFSLYSSNLRLTVSQIRKDYLFLQDFYSKTTQNWKQDLQITENTLQKRIQSTIEQYQSQSESQACAENELKTARREIEILQNEKELRLKTENELETLRSKFIGLTDEYERLTTEKKDFELNESNVRRKNDEIHRTRQAVLDRTRDEYEKLLRKYTDLDEVYRELVDQRTTNTSESKNLRLELDRLRQENIELNKQRETLIITHDVQLKKLDDSYSTKLHEAEQWPDRLQKELNHEREQHRLAKNELERQLRESFRTELAIEKQKSQDLLRKFEHETNYSTQQLRQELISTEKVTIEQRQYYTKQIEQLENEKEYLHSELDNLRNVLKDLHEQLKKQEQNQSENHLQLKEDLITKEKSLFQAESLVEQLQKELELTRDEMITLQETVHRECAEREQLKDALIDARQQLLTWKKNGVLNGTASRSLHSPPVAFAEIERSVLAPLPPSPPKQFRHQNPSFAQSEPTVRDHSLPGDGADRFARPMSASKNAPSRSKVLPPIIRSQPQRSIRRNPNSLSLNRPTQLLENQRRIARFIKHIK